MDIKTIYRKAADLLPRRFLLILRDAARYAGYEIDERDLLGMIVLATAIAFFIPFILYIGYLQIYKPLGLEFVSIGFFELSLAGLGFSFLTIAIIVVHLLNARSYRKEMCEKVFPDFLYLIASNLKGGLVPSQAFTYAIKPELGILAEEAKKAQQHGASQGSMIYAFNFLSQRIDSLYIKKFSQIFEKTMRHGGNFVGVLEDYAESMRKIIDLREELGAQAKGFMVFLLFVSVVILPFLSSVSSYYIKIVSSMKFGGDQTATVSLGSGSAQLGGKIELTPEDFLFYISIFIVLTNLTTSLLVGVLTKGDMVRGVKYFPVMAIIGLTVLFISMEVLKLMVPAG